MALRMGTSLQDDYGNSDKKESVSKQITFIGVWAFWKAPRFMGSPSVMLKGKNGNINIRVNRIIQRAPTTRVGGR
jgi:hypothetical protein